MSALTLFDWFITNDKLAHWVNAIGSMGLVTATAVITWQGGLRAKAELGEARAREAGALARTDAHRAERILSLRIAALSLLRHAQTLIEADSAGLRGLSGLRLAQAGRRGAVGLGAIEHQLLSFPAYELASVRATEIFLRAVLPISRARAHLQAIGEDAECIDDGDGPELMMDLLDNAGAEISGAMVDLRAEFSNSTGLVRRSRGSRRVRLR